MRLLGALSVLLLASLCHGARLTQEENRHRLRICGRPLSAFKRAASSPSASSFSDDGRPQFKVLGGRDSGPRPYAVQLLYKFSDTRDPDHCGGTMISGRHVLTAAHCVYDIWDFCYPAMPPAPREQVIRNKLDNWTIVLKSKCGEMNTNEECDKEDPKVFAKPVKIYANSQFYDARCMEGGDIAIIELDKDYGPEIGVVPACLATASTEIGQNTNLTSFGWGTDPSLKATYSRERFHDLLQEVDLKLQDCPRGSDVICTEERTKNVCKGDSGGGLMMRAQAVGSSTVVGVVSTGESCETMLVNPLHLEKFDGGLFTDARRYNAFICKFSGVCPLRKRRSAKHSRKQIKTIVDQIDII